MKVKAAIATAKEQPLVIENVEIDEPRPDVVQVRLVATGVCHTDEIVRDRWYPTPLPAVPGHEGAGIVEKVGSRSPASRPATAWCSASPAAARAPAATPATPRNAPTSPCATSVVLVRTAARPSELATWAASCSIRK
jgi:aryl-alcohol dehydrogenase